MSPTGRLLINGGGTGEPAGPNRLRWNLGKQQIEEEAQALMCRTRRVYDRVGSFDLAEVTYDNTLKELADIEVEYTGPLQLTNARLVYSPYIGENTWETGGSDWQLLQGWRPLLLYGNLVHVYISDL